MLLNPTNLLTPTPKLFQASKLFVMFLNIFKSSKTFVGFKHMQDSKAFVRGFQLKFQTVDFLRE
jgi:hypothetical protein